MKTEKKPKRIIRQGGPTNQVVLRPRNPFNRHKIKSSLPAPGGVGHLHLFIQGQ